MSYKILSLDGGGIRGLITAIWLDKLENELGAPLNQHFDLVAGTSTGGILAAAVGLGIPARNIVDLYRKHGQTIFPRAASRRWDRITRVFGEGFSAPKYSPAGLESSLTRIFGDRTLGELAKPTIIFSYNVFTREPVVFKSYKDPYRTIPVWQAVRASCSAPTYFPAMVMTVHRVNQPLIDGGVTANNPSACAIAEGIRLNDEKPASERIPLSDFVLASFGTGSSTRRITAKEAKEWGALEWVIPIIDVLFDGSTDAADYVARHIIAVDRYFRFQVELDKAYDDMDKADLVNLDALESIASSFINGTGARTLRTLCSAIRGTP